MAVPGLANEIKSPGPAFLDQASAIQRVQRNGLAARVSALEVLPYGPVASSAASGILADLAAMPAWDQTSNLRTRAEIVRVRSAGGSMVGASAVVPFDSTPGPSSDRTLLAPIVAVRDAASDAARAVGEEARGVVSDVAGTAASKAVTDWLDGYGPWVVGGVAVLLGVVALVVVVSIVKGR